MNALKANTSGSSRLELVPTNWIRLARWCHHLEMIQSLFGRSRGLSHTYVHHPLLTHWCPDKEDYPPQWWSVQFPVQLTNYWEGQTSQTWYLLCPSFIRTQMTQKYEMSHDKICKLEQDLHHGLKWVITRIWRIIGKKITSFTNYFEQMALDKYEAHHERDNTATKLMDLSIGTDSGQDWSLFPGVLRFKQQLSILANSIQFVVSVLKGVGESASIGVRESSLLAAFKRRMEWSGCFSPLRFLISPLPTDMASQINQW